MPTKNGISQEPAKLDEELSLLNDRIDSGRWPTLTCPDCNRNAWRICCQRHHHHHGGICAHCGNDERNPRTWVCHSSKN